MNVKNDGLATPRKWRESQTQKFPLADGERHRAPGLQAQMTGDFRTPKAGEWFISGAIPEAYFAVNDYAESTHYYIAKLIDPANPELPVEGWAIVRGGRGEEMNLHKVRILGQDSPPYLAGKIRYRIELQDVPHDPGVDPRKHVLYDRFFTDEKIAAKAYVTLLLLRIDEMQAKVRKLRERTGV